MELRQITTGVYRVVKPEYKSTVLVINDYDGEMDALKRKYWYLVADAVILHRANSLQDLESAISLGYKTQNDIYVAKKMREGKG